MKRYLCPSDYKFKITDTIYCVCILFLIIGSSSCLHAQQFPYLSGFKEGRYIWNPANLNSEGAKVASVYMRQQWFGLGLASAPRYLSATVQLPFEKNNMSASGGLYQDKSGPISSTGAVFNYAYHLKSFLTKKGQLSLGMSASFSGFAFNPSDEKYRDLGDPLLISNRSSAFYPALGG